MTTKATGPTSKAGRRPLYAVGWCVALGVLGLVMGMWQWADPMARNPAPGGISRAIPRSGPPGSDNPRAAYPQSPSAPGNGAVTQGAKDARKTALFRTFPPDSPPVAKAGGSEGPLTVSAPVPSEPAVRAEKPSPKLGTILVAAAAIPPQDWKVRNVYPDGLVIESTAGTTLRKVKFKDLPESVQRQYRYDPQGAARYEAEQTRAAAEYRVDLARKAAALRASQEAAAAKDSDQEREKVALLSKLVSDYHQSHTYSMEDRFVCADMACDVWNMVKTKGIQAIIKVGSVDRDITTLPEANHAWVLAEITPGEWLALETTAGRIVSREENPRYYCGWSFENPKQLKEVIYAQPAGP